MNGPVARECLPLRSDDHIVIVRQAVRKRAVEQGFSLVDQTKIVTAASELARNTIIHGGGGTATIEVLQEGMRRGIRLAEHREEVAEAVDERGDLRAGHPGCAASG